MPKRHHESVDDGFPQWFDVIVPDTVSQGEIFMSHFSFDQYTNCEIGIRCPDVILTARRSIRIRVTK